MKTLTTARAIEIIEELPEDRFIRGSMKADNNCYCTLGWLGEKICGNPDAGYTASPYNPINDFNDRVRHFIDTNRKDLLKRNIFAVVSINDRSYDVYPGENLSIKQTVIRFLKEMQTAGY